MSLRTRLIALVLVLTIALLGGLALYLSRSLRGWSEQALDDELARRAAAIASEVKWEDGELEVEHEAVEAAQGWPFRIEGPDGRVIASFRWANDEASAVAPSRSPTTLTIQNGERLRVLALTFQPHDGRGREVVLRIAAPVSTFAPLAERFRGGLLVALALAAVLSAVAAAGIAQLFLSPVRRLSREVGEIEARTLTRRLSTQDLDPELRRLAEAFNKMLDRLEQSFEGQRAFVGRASHALRTPVASILAQAEVTLRRARSPEEYQRALAEIAASARDAGHLAEGLLALTRADAAQTARAPERIRGAELAADLERLFRLRAEEAGLAFTATSDEVSFTADRARVREMLDAVMDNALRYTPRGGRVAFHAAPDAAGAVLAVDDSGPGIPAAERAQVTERFFRGDAAQKAAAPGHGLGLSVVRALAEAEGAQFAIDDSPLGGARVLLRFK